MDKEIIKSMLKKSTWINPEKKTVYKFINDNILSINSKNHLPYSINFRNDKIELQIGSEKRYFIEYVNDFILRLYNSNESIMITPE